MKFTHLEYFIALAESSSINEAAGKLYVAQPSLSKALQAMEQELGVQLFERNQGGIRLTAIGREILPEAKQALAYYDGWLQLAQRNTLRQVDVYVHVSLSGFLLPDIMFRFRERYPDVTIHYILNAAPRQFLTANLSVPVLTLDIFPRTVLDRTCPAPYTRKNLTLGHYGCLVSRNSTLAQHSCVTFADLAQYYLALPNDLKDLSERRFSPDPESFIPAISNFLPELLSHMGEDHIINVGSVGNVTELAVNRPGVFALSISPFHHRYPGVVSGELVHVPIAEESVQSVLCLTYCQKAYKQHPFLRALVAEIESGVGEFADAYSDPGENLL